MTILIHKLHIYSSKEINFFNIMILNTLSDIRPLIVLITERYDKKYPLSHYSRSLIRNYKYNRPLEKIYIQNNPTLKYIIKLNKYMHLYIHSKSVNVLQEKIKC